MYTQIDNAVRTTDLMDNFIKTKLEQVCKGLQSRRRAQPGLMLIQVERFDLCSKISNLSLTVPVVCHPGKPEVDRTQLQLHQLQLFNRDISRCHLTCFQAVRLLRAGEDHQSLRIYSNAVFPREYLDQFKTLTSSKILNRVPLTRWAALFQNSAVVSPKLGQIVFERGGIYDKVWVVLSGLFYLSIDRARQKIQEKAIFINLCQCLLGIKLSWSMRCQSSGGKLLCIDKLSLINLLLRSYTKAELNQILLGEGVKQGLQLKKRVQRATLLRSPRIHKSLIVKPLTLQNYDDLLLQQMQQGIDDTRTKWADRKEAQCLSNEQTQQKGDVWPRTSDAQKIGEFVKTAIEVEVSTKKLDTQAGDNQSEVEVYEQGEHSYSSWELVVYFPKLSFNMDELTVEAQDGAVLLPMQMLKASKLLSVLHDFDQPIVLRHIKGQDLAKIARVCKACNYGLLGIKVRSNDWAQSLPLHVYEEVRFLQEEDQREHFVRLCEDLNVELGLELVGSYYAAKVYFRDQAGFKTRCLQIGVSAPTIKDLLQQQTNHPFILKH